MDSTIESEKEIDPMSHKFHEIAPEEWSGNVFEKIGKDWMLVSAEAEAGKPNTMTASWGGAGILWGKPVAFVFLRPQRYTTGLVEQTGSLSLSFFRGDKDPFPTGKYSDVVHTTKLREALRYCGSHSGRDGDKFSAAGITPAYEDGIPYVAEADSVFLCRVLYRSVLEEAKFLSPELLDNYKQKDYHNVYICGIEKILKAE